VQPTLANIAGRKLVASGAHPGLAWFRKQRNFPECIVKLYSREARWKINTNSANSCNICAFMKHMHYQQCLFRYRYVFMLSLSYRYRVNVDCVIFTLCSY